MILLQADWTRPMWVMFWILITIIVCVLGARVIDQIKFWIK